MCVEMVARVVSLDGDAHTAVVDDGMRRHRISTALLALEGVRVVAGDHVAVHTGIAVRRVSPVEAAARRSVA
ncbi:MAG TPA: HypC/HybG/HupF family hydrogenase formation chaperone [Candidatus Dormibacteraeota bacterium]|nr:HypC/HybG/HupF family hydrogenase formation chaperone [Candidatus Dormibacteraeota bacterium]